MRSGPPQTVPLQMDCNRRVVTVQRGLPALSRWAPGSGRQAVTRRSIPRKPLCNSLAPPKPGPPLGRLGSHFGVHVATMLQQVCRASTPKPSVLKITFFAVCNYQTTKSPRHGGTLTCGHPIVPAPGVNLVGVSRSERLVEQSFPSPDLLCCRTEIVIHGSRNTLAVAFRLKKATVCPRSAVHWVRSTSTGPSGRLE